MFPSAGAAKTIIYNDKEKTDIHSFVKEHHHENDDHGLL
jgi:hypothetical protein